LEVPTVDVVSVVVSDGSYAELSGELSGFVSYWQLDIPEDFIGTHAISRNMASLILGESDYGVMIDVSGYRYQFAAIDASKSKDIHAAVYPVNACDAMLVDDVGSPYVNTSVVVRSFDGMSVSQMANVRVISDANGLADISKLAPGLYSVEFGFHGSEDDWVLGNMSIFDGCDTVTISDPIR